MTLRLLPALLLLVLGLTLSPGHLRAAPSDENPDTGDAETSELQPAPDEGELNTFAWALVRLVGVQHGYMMMMQAEQDPIRIEEMKRHAVEDMTDAVQQDGLSVERYNAIAAAMKTDSRLQSRVESILQQMAATREDEGEEE